MDNYTFIHEWIIDNYTFIRERMNDYTFITGVLSMDNVYKFK